MRVGAHCSVSKGYPKAAEYLISIGGNAMQIFSGNPRGWKKSPIDTKKADEFTEIRKELGIFPLIIHSPYLINLAGSGKVLEKSLDAFEEELQRADTLSAEYFVIHPGSGGQSGVEEATERVIEGLSRVLDKSKPAVKVLLENTAGGKSSPGKDLNNLLHMHKALKGKTGFCLDTAHAFESGYTMKELTAHPLTEEAEAVHINDSMTGKASGHDRHAHIGEGEIGIENIRAIVNHPRLREVPFILETPKEGDMDSKNISLLKKLRDQSSR